MLKLTISILLEYLWKNEYFTIKRKKVIQIIIKESFNFKITPNKETQERIKKRILIEMERISSVEEARQEIKILEKKNPFQEEGFYIEEKVKYLKEYIAIND